MPSHVQDKTKLVRTAFSYIDSQLSHALTFIVAAAIAYDTAILIRLKSGNPYNIPNITHMLDNWYPENNYIRVVYIIFASVAIYLLLRWLNHRSVKWFRILIALFAALTIFFGVMVQSSTTNAIDTFHNGEQLAPTLAYVHGKHLFSDIFFLHGAGEDVLIPALSFSIFSHGHPSIGSYILLTDILETVSLFLFFILLARLLKPDGLFLFATLWFVGTAYNGADYMKNIPVYIVLGVYWLWFNRSFSLRVRCAMLGVIGFISSLTLLDSIDVGVIMTLIAGLIAVILLFTEEREDRSLTLRMPPRTLTTLAQPASVALGVLLGQLVILLFLGSHSFAAYIKMTFIDIPRFQGLTWDYPINQLTSAFYLFWLPIILAGIALCMLATLAYSELRKNRYLRPELAYAALLMLFSGLYLRFGVGRPDYGHINEATPVLFLTSFYIIYLYVKALPIRGQWNVWPVVLFGILLFWPQTTWDPITIFSGGNITPTQVSAMIHLPTKPDNSWLTPQELAVTNYIKSHSKPTDGLLVVEPEPLYYYLADRPNPSRFYIVWDADSTQYDTELLHSLEKNPPKLIIYSGPSAYEISDSIPITQRIPLANKWILKNYETKTVLDQYTILSR